MSTPRLSPPVLIGAAVALTAAIAAVGALGIPAGRATPGTASEADGVDILRDEVGALRAGGVPADDPKLAPLEDDLAELEQAAGAAQPGEPGLDMTSVLGTPAGRGARSVTMDDTGDTDEAGAAADDATVWDRGPVECEPLPPDVLTADELDGARCVSAPQPDGTSRYTALTPDGTLRVVRFDQDGSLSREPDRQLDGLDGVSLDQVGLTVDELGDLVVTVPGGSAPTDVDL